jgi:phosphotransferase system  glucose/maltose/N-acetylglucosamine-specific IIC component
MQKQSQLFVAQTVAVVMSLTLVVLGLMLVGSLLDAVIFHHLGDPIGAKATYLTYWLFPTRAFLAMCVVWFIRRWAIRKRRAITGRKGGSDA